MSAERTLIILILLWWKINPAVVVGLPVTDSSKCPAIEYDKSISAATCRFCFEEHRPTEIYVANLSPTISPSRNVDIATLTGSTKIDSADSQKFKFHHISIGVTSTNSASVYYTRKPIGFTSKTCLPICITIKEREFENETKEGVVPDGSFVIFKNKVTFSPEEEALIGQKRLTIGTLVGNPLRFQVIQRIVLSGGHVLSNLRLPAKFNCSQKLHGHLFVFSPLDTDTSTLAETDLSINLAQLTVTSNDDLLCGKSVEPIELNNDWNPRIPTLGHEYYRPSVEQKSGRFQFMDHYGTHLDFANPVPPTGVKLPGDQLPICSAIGSCVKIRSAALGPNDSVPLSVFTRWEAINGQKLPEMVFIETGYEASHWNTSDKFFTEFPGVDLDAIEFLLENRSVKVIGIDSAMLDRHVHLSTLPNHLAMAKHDTVALVMMKTRGLQQLSDSTPATCLLNYFRIENGTGSPASVVAFQATKKQQHHPSYNVFGMQAITFQEKIRTTSVTTVVAIVGAAGAALLLVIVARRRGFHVFRR